MSSFFHRFKRLCRRFQKQEDGITLIEISLATTIIAIAYLGLTSILENFAQQIRAQAVADRMAEVNLAVAQYVEANAGTLLAAANMMPIEIPIADIVAGGAVNTALVDAGGDILNAEGQIHRVIARREGDSLETIVFTEGNVLPETISGQVSGLLGGNGAVVFEDIARCEGVSNLCLSSNGGASIVDLNLYPDGLRPAAGAVASIIFSNRGQLLAPYLYRDVVAGRDEANTMTTDLHLDTGPDPANRVPMHLVTGADDVEVLGLSVKGSPVWASQAVYDVTIINSGGFVEEPLCTTTGGTPRVSASLVSFAHPDGFPLSQVILDAVTATGPSTADPTVMVPGWRITIRVVGQTGILDLDGTFGRVEAKTFCR